MATAPAVHRDRVTSLRELIRGASVIFRKHMLKFSRNSMEIGGTLGSPLLIALTFGVGMNGVVDRSLLGADSYLTFITAGILAFTALNGAVNSGMTILEEKLKGGLKEYLVAPIPRMSILLGSALSGLVKSLLQALIILVVTVLFGAQLKTSPVGVILAMLLLLPYMLAFVGFGNGFAMRAKSVGGYHITLFMLTVPLLFLSNSLYPLATLPGWMQVAAYLNPTTYLVDGLRHTLFANGSLPLWLDALVLVGWAVVLAWYGVRSFRRAMG
jgi:ABC-2 type transport system permease protein